MSVNSTQGTGSSNQLFLSKWALREALEPLQVQTFGLEISRMTYARINRKPESVFLTESLSLVFLYNVRDNHINPPAKNQGGLGLPLEVVGESSGLPFAANVRYADTLPLTPDPG